MEFNVGSMGAVIDGNRILLIKRVKFPFVGLWAMPSGKVKPGEHIEETAVREIKEETNIDTDFEELLGVISEHVVEGGKLIGHFILFLSKMNPRHTNHKTMEEGEVQWFNLNEIEKQRGMIVPSDYLMIKNMVLRKNGKLFRSITEKSGEKYTQKTFEAIS